MSCAKCRQCSRHESDTWCLGCTAAQALGTELAAHWATPALRAVANDLVVSAVRGVVALREISGSIQSAGASRAALERQTASTRAEGRSPARREEPRAPRSSSAKQVKEQVEEESSEEESEEEEPERDSPVPVGAVPKSAPVSRPPEPSGPPPERAPLQRRPQPVKRHHSENTRDRPRRRREGKSSRRGSRGGGKHPRLYRTLDNPDIQVHRKPPKDCWRQDRPLAGPWGRSRRS